MQILSSDVTSEGTWVQVDCYWPGFTVAVYGFKTGDIAQIYLSDTAALPSATTPPAGPAAGDGTFQFGSDISADTLVEITVNTRWLRVRKSAAGTPAGTTVAELQGVRRFW